MAFKTKVCTRCGNEYQPHNGHQKYCYECRPIVDKSRGVIRRQNKPEWYAAYNAARATGRKIRTCLVCGKEYQPTSSTQKYCPECRPIISAAKKVVWRKENSVKDRASTPAYYAAHREKIAAYLLWWTKMNPEKTRAHNEKQKAQRRVLGFIPLNKPFDGCNGHHLDNDYVLHIPNKMNQSISHNVRTGRNMTKINTLAVQWWMSQVMRTGHTLPVGG